MTSVMRGLVAAALACTCLAAPAFAANPLPAGEYSCVGSGGDVLIGLGFGLKADGTYTDLDSTTGGTWTIADGQIVFTGGHLDGYAGRDIKDNGFTIAEMASCQLWNG